ncbi:hypothetical protein E1281_27340 [Actinomadura sp. KC345]|uniref:hypothetical protein n=1 Tax=Actinomadura sp. KC345 TaxID=2530371 RepID=UPI001052C4C1|nr:hypothetical protein [Actinomadura sp. KC345]TDC46766.1 hypothetical protein E1281_27340 [Actinomadura sp. KC345]
MPTKRRGIAALLLAVSALLASGCTLGTTDDQPTTHAEGCSQAERALANLPGTEALTRALESKKNSEDVYAVIWVDVHRLQAHTCTGSPEADPRFMAIHKTMLISAIDEVEPAVMSTTVYRPVASELAALVRLPGSEDTAVERFHRLMETVDGDLTKTGVGGDGPLTDTSVSGYLFVGDQGYGHWPDRASRLGPGR